MPTTREFLTFPTNYIIIPERMRKEFTSQDFDRLYLLELSIRKYGLLHPILVTRELILVAGHRRLLCHIRLNLPTISCQYYDEISANESIAIELEENLRRLKMNWREVMTGIGKYHTHMQKENPLWTSRDSSLSLQIPGTTVNKNLQIYPFRLHPEILTSKSFAQAIVVARRLKAREIQNELAMAI